jgi:hypothetical protein
LYESFKNSPDGFSARKLTAFLCVAVAAYETYKHTNDTNITTVIMIWLTAGFLCLGIITMEQVTNLKNGNNGKTTE